MNTELNLHTELAEDIPLLLAQLEKLRVGSLLDECFPTHGRWQGLSLGQVTSGWLSYILSEGDHRLSHVQPWAGSRLGVLSACLGEEVRELDFSDDRLALVLDALSDDGRWEGFEQALTGHTLRVYDLSSNRTVRLDTTTAKSYVSVDEGGLFQFGHSKDHRPDLPQVKISLSTLDPLGLPLTTTAVSGERADDPLYVPEMKRVQQVLGGTGLSFIGDSKMGALSTRAQMQASGQYYLCPLSAVQMPEAMLEGLLEPVWKGEQALTRVEVPTEAAEPTLELIAEGFEVRQTLNATVEGEEVNWSERRLVIRSLKFAASQTQGLDERLSKAQAEIASFNEHGQGKKRWREEAPLREAVETVIKRHRVSGLLSVSYHTTVEQRQVRGYGSRAARVEHNTTVSVTSTIDPEALERTRRRLGWRVYASNHPVEQLGLAQAVNAYRSAYRIERGFGRFKGKVLSLTPIYLDSDARVTGLIRLLSIGLRVLTLLEFQVRQQLQQTQQSLAGLYPGNPKRATAQPTAEMMLRAFRGLILTQLTLHGQPQVHLTPLNPVQERILDLLGLRPKLYSDPGRQFAEQGLCLSEP